MTATGALRGARLARRLRRRSRWSPLTILGELAVRNPRAAVLLGGFGLATFGVVLLLSLASVQAFFVLSGQSSITADRRLALFADGDQGPNGGDATAAAGAAVALASNTALPTATGEHPTEPVGPDEVVSIEGIRVHTSIAANFQALMDAAAADGVNLSGWGWRDTRTQVRLRREHCGTSDYAIYRMPSGRCSPPTARPGSSQHERGLAIDFTYNGGSISTHRNPGFRWLSANAEAFGFRNLASEPWHWSTTGR